MTLHQIRKHKGKMIMLTYKVKGYQHEQSGVITAASRHTILFNVNNNGTEIPLKYDQIIEVKSTEKCK